MSDLFADMAADANAAPKADLLETVGKLADQQDYLEEQILTAENELKALKRDLDVLTGETLPAALQEAGLSAVSLTDGTKIEVERTVHANISAANWEAAKLVLQDMNADHIIKNEFKLNFGKGEGEDASQFKALLEEQGLHAKQKEHVHPSTLKAFIKEQLEAGTDLPFDTFGIYLGQRTKIKRK